MSTPLSKEIQDMIFVSLLGDGSLAIQKNYSNARFSFRHSSKQKEYFFWKANFLKEITSKQSTWLQGKNQPDGWGDLKYRFQSGASEQLTNLYFITHIGVKGTKVRIKRAWLNKMSPLSLAIWWLDDGSLVSDTRQGVFCTDGFTLKEVKILRQYLKKVWKVETSIGQVKESEKYRLWIRSTDELKKFLRIIIPHIHVKDMLYKILLLYKDATFQQCWISEVVKLGNFSKEIIEEIIFERKKNLKNFR